MGQDASQTTRRKACIRRLQNGKKPKTKPLKNGKKSTKTGDTATGFTSRASLKTGTVVIHDLNYSSPSVSAVHTHEARVYVPVPVTSATKHTPLSTPASTSVHSLLCCNQKEKKESRVSRDSFCIPFLMLHIMLII